MIFINGFFYGADVKPNNNAIITFFSVFIFVNVLQSIKFIINLQAGVLT